MRQSWNWFADALAAANAPRRRWIFLNEHPIDVTLSRSELDDWMDRRDQWERAARTAVPASDRTDIAA